MYHKVDVPDWWLERFPNTYVEYNPIKDVLDITVYARIGDRSFRFDGDFYTEDFTWTKVVMKILQDLIDLTNDGGWDEYNHLVWKGRTAMKS